MSCSLHILIERNSFLHFSITVLAALKAEPNATGPVLPPLARLLSLVSKNGIKESVLQRLNETCHV